jgi:DNA-binding NarL/FixJ family response regulator
MDPQRTGGIDHDWLPPPIPLPSVFEEAAALWRALVAAGVGPEEHGGVPTEAKVHATRLLSAALACHRALAAPAPAADAAPAPPPPGPFSGLSLTAREREVLRLVAAGQSDRAIARALGISWRTATTHLTHILTKLGVDNRTAAAARAVRDGLA